VGRILPDEKKVPEYLLSIAVLTNMILVIPRLIPGIPQGVDSTSHLSKILFMFKWYSVLGHVPSWYPDWYGGAPFLLLYSPLSYWLTFGIALTGAGAVTAYKIVDAISFVAAPITLYLLGRELDLEAKEAAWASLLFVLTPTVVGNYLFYDRFANTVTLPVVCLFLTYLIRMLKGRKMINSLILSTVLLAGSILVHHLSAFLALLIALLVLFSYARDLRKFKNALPLFLAVVVLAVGLSSPWLLNFIQASAQISENPFFNKNVQFPFIKLTYALKDYLGIEQGLIHFLLAAVIVGQWASRKHGGRNSLFSAFGMLFLGMGIFELGSYDNVWIMTAGQALVIIALVFLLGLVTHGLGGRKCSPAELFLALWFTVFFWLGLGYYAMPLANLPIFQSIWRSLDIHRYWLYLSIPIALMAGKVVGRVAHPPVRKLSMVGLSLILIIVFAGAAVKAGYSLTQDVNPHLPYTTQNAEIPQALLDYFRSKDEYGRILPIRCPMWVYLLPTYTGKALIDGWYPQEKLLPILLDIEDYRINDLETTPNRTEYWKELVNKNQELDIHWVLIGNANSSLVTELCSSTFKQDAFIGYGVNNLTILRNTVENPPVRVLDSALGDGVRYHRPEPDKIVLDIPSPIRDLGLIVSEAYYPGWTALIDGKELKVQRTDDQSPTGEEGLILVRASSAPARIVIRYANPDNPHAMIFIAAAGVLALVWVLSKIRVKRTGRGRAE